MDTVYRTPFRLLDCVNDYDAAREYLTEDDMTEYLREDLDDSCTYFRLPMAHLKDKIEHIEWHLIDENSGYIELITSEEIPQSELDQISEWVSGQCSDGLGEGFEQQPFANYQATNSHDSWGGDYEDEDWNVDDEYDDWVMCSFDWKTNKYYFSRVEGKN